MVTEMKKKQNVQGYPRTLTKERTEIINYQMDEKTKEKNVRFSGSPKYLGLCQICLIWKFCFLSHEISHGTDELIQLSKDSN